MQELKIKGIYKHFKGDYYLVEDVEKDSETQEEFEFYKELFTYQLQQKQKLIIKQKDFVI